MLTLQTASDTDHDNVVVEINHSDQFLCLLSKEESDDEVMIELPIEFPANSPGSFKRMGLSEFIQIIRRAEDQLVNPS